MVPPGIRRDLRDDAGFLQSGVDSFRISEALHCYEYRGQWSFGHVILGYETQRYAKLTVRRSSDIQLADRLLSQLFGRS